MGGTNYISHLVSEVNTSKFIPRSISVTDRFDSNALNGFSKRSSTQDSPPVNSGNDGVIHDQQTIPSTAIIIIVVLMVLFLVISLSTFYVFFLRRRRQRLRRREMSEVPFPHRQYDLPASRTTSNSSQAPLVSVQIPPVPPVSYHTYVPVTGRDGTKYLVPRPSVRREVIPATTLPSFTKESFPITGPSNRTFQKEPGSTTPNLDDRFLIAQPGHILKVVNGTPLDIDGRASLRIPSPQVPTSISTRRLTYTDLPRINTGFSGEEFYKAVAKSRAAHNGSIDSTTSRANSGDSWETNTSSSRRPRGGRPLPMPPSIPPSIPPALLPRNPPGRR